MKKAVCNVSLSPIRQENSEISPQISQILYGEKVEILEITDGFAKINWLQNEEGWMDKRHLKEISEQEFTSKNSVLVSQNFGVYNLPEGKTLLSIGSEIEDSENAVLKEQNGEEIAKTALEFLNVPYVSGGRSFFGVDAEGFVQLIFKVHGISIPRNLEDMSNMGDALFFVGESEAGDLAFFGDEEGKIIHVGIMLNNFEIIHADEKVRIDSIDSSGIFNKELKKHTFLLRVVKRIL